MKVVKGITFECCPSEENGWQRSIVGSTREVEMGSGREEKRGKTEVDVLGEEKGEKEEMGEQGQGNTESTVEQTTLSSDFINDYYYVSKVIQYYY